MAAPPFDAERSSALARRSSLAPASADGRSREAAFSERAVRLFFAACGGFALVTTLLILTFVARTGIRGVRDVGLVQLLTGTLWRPDQTLFGGLPLLVGTLLSATGAVLFGAIPAVLVALWITEFAPKWLKGPYRRLMEITAALPSVVYGWLALVNLVPFMEKLGHAIHGEDAPVSGEGLGSASLLLGAMIIPTVLLLSLDALARVPVALKDASLALGASRWQTAFRIVLPHAWRGLLTAVFFGFARAAGETMAVQMVIGNARLLPKGLFSPTVTISTQIVMDMQNTRPNTTASDVLYSMALVLLVLSSAIVLTTRAIGRKASA